MKMENRRFLLFVVRIGERKQRRKQTVHCTCFVKCGTVKDLVLHAPDDCSVTAAGRKLSYMVRPACPLGCATQVAVNTIKLEEFGTRNGLAMRKYPICTSAPPAVTKVGKTS